MPLGISKCSFHYGGDAKPCCYFFYCRAVMEKSTKYLEFHIALNQKGYVELATMEYSSRLQHIVNIKFPPNSNFAGRNESKSGLALWIS